MAADFFSKPSGLDPDGPGIRITLAHVKTFLPRYKWVITGVFVLTVLSAYGALSLMTELYEVRSALLVKLGRENLDAPATARNTVLSTGVRPQELGSEVQILKSADLAAQVVDELGVEAFRVQRVPPQGFLPAIKYYTKAAIRAVRDQIGEGLIALDLKKRLSDREQAIAIITDDLVAEPAKDSDVVSLRLKLADPNLAVRVQETLIRKYMARRVEVRQSPGVKEFFDRETENLKAALDKAEQARNEWKRQRDLSLPAEQKALLLKQITELSAERGRALTKAQSVSREMTAASNLIATSSETVRAMQIETPNPSLQLWKERLAKLEGEHAQMLTTYKAGAPPMTSKEEEIATLRQLITAQEQTQVGSVTSQINPLRQQLQQYLNEDSVELEGLSASAAFQARELRRLQTALLAIEEADAVLATLERDRIVAEQNYLEANKRRADATIENQLDLSRISNVSIAMPPVAAVQPVYPRKLLIMALSLLVGLVLGVVSAVVLEWTSDTLHDAEQIAAATSLVCLGSFGSAGDDRIRETA